MLITLVHLADMLGLTPKALRQRLYRNPDDYPPVVSLGPRTRRFDKDTVDRWLRAKNAKGHKLFRKKEGEV